jgi:eukaryotic translation initiation factor 2C
LSLNWAVKFQSRNISNEVSSPVSYHLALLLLIAAHLEYKVTLRYPDIPLVDVGGQKSNLLPAEMCEILPNQPFRGKLTDEHTAAMITVAAKPPNVNAMSIVDRGLDELGFKSGCDQLSAFGISVGTEMTVVPGRILTPPGIRYGQGTPSVDERASWNLRNVKFHKGARLENWAVLVILDGNTRDEFSKPDDPELQATYRGFASMCKNSGMSVDQKDPAVIAARLPPKTPSDPIRAAAVGTIQQQLKSLKTKPSLVLILLSSGDKHVYAGIKHLCDSYLDLGRSLN